jgi:hypothetical protein
VTAKKREPKQKNLEQIDTTSAIYEGFKGFIPDSKLITVAKIEIEPQFSIGQLNYSKRGSTPKIRIIDNACVDAVNEFYKKYKKTFGQEWKIE